MLKNFFRTLLTLTLLWSCFVTFAIVEVGVDDLLWRAVVFLSLGDRWVTCVDGGCIDKYLFSSSWKEVIVMFFCDG